MSVTTLRLCDRDTEFWYAGASIRPVQRIRRVVVHGYLVAQHSTPQLNSGGVPVPAADVIQHDVVLVDRPHASDTGWQFSYEDLRFRVARQAVARPASYGWYQHIHLMLSPGDVDALRRLHGKLITLHAHEVAVGLMDDEIPGLRNEGQALAWLGARALVQDEAELAQVDKEINAIVGSGVVSNCLILELQHLSKTAWTRRFIHFIKGAMIMAAGGTAAAQNALNSLKKAGEKNANERQQRSPNPNHADMMRALGAGGTLPGKDKK